MITRNIALAFVSQHLMTNVYNFAKGISDQGNHDKQYGWNNYNQEKITMSNGNLTMLVDKHHDFYHHHYQRM